MPGEEEKSSPILDVLLIILTAAFSTAGVVYAVDDYIQAIIPLMCALMFFAMYMASKGVIGGH